ncbi:MAG TPA: SPOR domain-containing protein [Gaiellaceae bacterium]|nr:SPOR domain-containing protein [Gaiellaceae bacterium]
MADDWRIRIDVADERDTLLERLGMELDDEARELARGLEQRRLAVSRDGDELFVYASTHADAEQARSVVDQVIGQSGLKATTSGVEHWLEDEERWSNEPPGESWEDEARDEGYAPWEVRVTTGSRAEARALAERLEAEGLQPIRRFHLVIVGADTKEAADELAARLHGEVEASPAVVEPLPSNPFAIFGGLGT